MSFIQKDWKIPVSLAVCLSAFICNAQHVEIKGGVKDTLTKHIPVEISVNDTLRKFRKKVMMLTPEEERLYSELLKNKNLTAKTDASGNFSIAPRKTDTLFFHKSGYYTQKYPVSDLLKMKNIDLEMKKEPCVPFKKCEQKKPSNFYVFIGEKVEVLLEETPNYCDQVLDSKLKSTHKIIKPLYGNFPKDTITFYSTSHYGIPTILQYQTILLFVGEYCGDLYQEKYQYFDLFKTKNGRWACPGNPYKYDLYVKDKNIKPQQIEFDESVFFDLSKLSAKEIEKKFSQDYYKIVGTKAIPIKGTYAEDLIKIKKDLFLEKGINLN